MVNSHWLGRTLFSEAITKNIHVVHNGIDPDKFSLSQNRGPSFREAFGISPDTVLVGLIGAIHQRKGHETFIDAASRVVMTAGHICYVIIGDGVADHVGKIRQKVASTGLAGNFIFTGWRNDVANVMTELDIIVVASEQEAFGRVVIEAMALKKAIVATRSGGPEEIITNGVTGFLVPVRDAESMADRITTLAMDPELRRRVGARGFETVVREFGEKAYMVKLQKIIREAARL